MRARPCVKPVIMTLKRRLSVALLVFAATGLSRDARSEGVAVIDLQGAVMQTEDGIRAQATLKKLFDKRQQDLDGKQTQLSKARQDIDKQQRILSREALSRRVETWQREMMQLQTVFLDYNKELQKKQNEITAPIIQRLVAIVGRLAKQNGYDIVIDKQAAPYARPDLDLTERAIQLYNAGDAGDADPKKAAP
jgi:outer membrane protein